ncbi:transcription-repair coupling factor, partial [bacterium]|nr:transcription-repair coupling factor [candidate division CSSED10-310 bacterium]
SEIKDSLSRLNVIDLGYPVEMNDQLLSDSFSPSPRFGGQMEDFLDFVSHHGKRSKKIFVISKQVERLEELIAKRSDVGRNDSKIELINGSVSGGWRAVNQKKEITYLFSDKEIFGWQRPLPRIKRTKNYKSPEFSYADLAPGDLVVHIDYGIGRFEGLVSRTLDNVDRDYLKISYANDDELFVPVHQADRLTLYIGPDARIPRLSKFGSEDWETKKKKVADAVERVASDLLELYAHRQSAKGFSYSQDTEWQRILESNFPYTETYDQTLAISQVKRDMENDRPMDRLLCGDVGYGKTEVALRAAFKAVMDSKQVAILVPTTVLAQQHYDTFISRLVPFPVKVDMLSRFRSIEEQEIVLRGLETGEIDIVIGTHRLIQKDIQIPNLGLLIIDEEQRFGVSHKEFFKLKRKEVDVLTLTATPIPRTLYMALSGIRDISVINTAPVDRIPIQTFIGGYDPEVVRRAIMREIDRGGQVFFVHNRVKTISAISAHLQRIVPEARIGIAHGQMKEKMLETVMKKFVAGEIDVLLSTSIIESGLDIPNANTLIVDRGDTFGLAQLYQLRGRVGRGSSRAYAYLFHHNKKKPTPEGMERLETIAENSHLGAGYSIAMRDLEMRGAGELLGHQQHGHIAAVGFHLYTRLLAIAISQKKQPEEKVIYYDDNSLIRPLVSVDLPIYAGIPKEYIPNDQLRINMYRRVSNITNMEDVEQLRFEFIDRFGMFDKNIENLLWLLKVKILATNIGLSAISLEGTNIVLRFPVMANDISKRNLPDLGESIRTGKNGYWLSYDDASDWQTFLLKKLDELKNKIICMKVK